LVRKLGPEKTTDFHDPNLPPCKHLHHIVDSSGHGPPGKKKIHGLVLNVQFEDTNVKVSCGTTHSGCCFTNNSAGILWIQVGIFRLTR